jgi:hypothetical protein
MTVQEILKKIGGVNGLQRHVLKRHPNPSNAIDPVPRARHDFEKYLSELRAAPGGDCKQP